MNTPDGGVTDEPMPPEWARAYADAYPDRLVEYVEQQHAVIDDFDEKGVMTHTSQSERNIPMNFDNITIGQAKQIAALVNGIKSEPTCTVTAHDPIPVIVCTDKRGVVFGYTTDTNARPIVLTAARMCLYWSADVGGVFGLAEVGPTKDCKISAVVPSITLEGVTAIMSVDDKAVKAWASAKTQGR